MPDVATDIQYDSYDFQDDTIITRDVIGDDSAPPKSVGVYELPVLHGAKKTFEKYQARRITLRGIVKSTTASGLVGKMEELKEVATRQDKTLQISYPSYNRIYTASVEAPPKFERPAYAINLAEYEMTFVAVEPWSVQTQTSVSGVYNVNSAITSLAVGISGMLDPQPVIYFNTLASGSRFSFVNTTTGDTIDVPTTFSGTGRSLKIDTYDFNVTLDGDPVPFKGTFPRFNPGVNNLVVTTYGTAASAIDQAFQDTSLSLGYASVGGPTNFRAQSFQPAVTSSLIAIEVYLRAVFMGGGAITLEIQSNSSGKPSNTVLATATIPATNSTTPSWKRATFSTALAVTAGTTYWIVLKSTASTFATYGWGYYSASSQYSSGQAAGTTDGGVVWSTFTYDRLFRTYNDWGTALTGKLVIGYNPRRL